MTSMLLCDAHGNTLATLLLPGEPLATALAAAHVLAVTKGGKLCLWDLGPLVGPLMGPLAEGTDPSQLKTGGPVQLSLHPHPSHCQSLSQTITSSNTGSSTNTSNTTGSSTAADGGHGTVVALAAGTRVALLAMASGVLYVLSLPQCTLIGVFGLGFVMVVVVLLSVPCLHILCTVHTLHSMYTHNTPCTYNHLLGVQPCHLIPTMFSLHPFHPSYTCQPYTGQYTRTSSHPLTSMRLNCNDTLLIVLDAGDTLDILALAYTDDTTAPPQNSILPTKTPTHAPAHTPNTTAATHSNNNNTTRTTTAAASLQPVGSIQDVWAWVWHGQDAQCVAVVGRKGVRVWRDGQLGDPLMGPESYAHLQLTAFDGLSIQVWPPVLFVCGVCIVCLVLASFCMLFASYLLDFLAYLAHPRPPHTSATTGSGCCRCFTCPRTWPTAHLGHHVLHHHRPPSPACTHSPITRGKCSCTGGWCVSAATFTQGASCCERGAHEGTATGGKSGGTRCGCFCDL